MDYHVSEPVQTWNVGKSLVERRPDVFRRQTGVQPSFYGEPSGAVISPHTRGLKLNRFESRQPRHNTGAGSLSENTDPAYARLLAKLITIQIPEWFLPLCNAGTGLGQRVSLLAQLCVYVGSHRSSQDHMKVDRDRRRVDDRPGVKWSDQIFRLVVWSMWEASLTFFLEK